MTTDANQHRLRYEDKTFILLGTAHVSKESAEAAERLIEAEQPDTVCVELCRARYQSLTQENQWRNTNLIQVIREKKAFLLLSNLLLSAFQKRIGQKLGIKPGEEMLRAVRAAERIGAHVQMADRDIRTTLSRTWRLMSWWSKIKLLAQSLTAIGGSETIKQEDIEEMKKQDVLESLLSEIGEKLPGLRRVLIDERDQYLAHRIRSAPGKKIVAVVGAGHVPGIKTYWQATVDTASLDEIPPRGRLFGLIKWIIPVAVAGLIVVGFFMAGAEAGRHMIKWWILANGVFAGIGAAMALAHPLTILTAIAASPLTSMNPMIAAGWVAGLVETFIGKPKVKDFERLSDDILSFRGFWRNKVTRILLVVVLTNVGSSVGAAVALPLMMKILT